MKLFPDECTIDNRLTYIIVFVYDTHEHAMTYGADTTMHV